MARQKSTPLRTALSRMFPTALLKRLASETGMVRRRRRVDPVKLFWVLVLTLGSGRSRSFAELRRSYERVAGVRLSASSFYNRFTPAFTQFLRELLVIGLRSSAATRREPGRSSARSRTSSAWTPRWSVCTTHWLAAGRPAAPITPWRRSRCTRCSMFEVWDRSASRSRRSGFTTDRCCELASG